MDNEKKIAEEQPFPLDLMPEMPVNYYLFVRSVSENFDVSPLNLRSDLHHTHGYLITPFYKSVSSIL
jgi:hypothetical protein